MALLRRGSSKISDENFNARLQRESAKSGAITVSLAWNDPSDLDLHAFVNGEHIFYRNKRAASGELDVDMHATAVVAEPVENIFWKKAPAGEYSIKVSLFKQRGPASTAGVPFRCILKREDEEDISREGVVKTKAGFEVFKFTVDADSSVQVEPGAKPQTLKRTVKAMKIMKAMKVMKAVEAPAPAKAKAESKAGAKAKAAAAKARARAAVAKARARAAVAKAKAKAKARALAAKAKAKVAAARARAKASAKKKKLAKGKRAKQAVFKGKVKKTLGGLKKGDLVKGNHGKIVSAKRQAMHKKNKWARATKQARKELGITGFQPVKKGTAFYERVTAIRDSL